jgi:hypothetical protein
VGVTCTATVPRGCDTAGATCARHQTPGYSSTPVLTLITIVGIPKQKRRAIGWLSAVGGTSKSRQVSSACTTWMCSYSRSEHLRARSMLHSLGALSDYGHMPGYGLETTGHAEECCRRKERSSKLSPCRAPPHGGHCRLLQIRRTQCHLHLPCHRRSPCKARKRKEAVSKLL